MSDELSSGELISAEEPIIHLTENGIEGFEILCRLCANSSDHLISIYSEEGITNDLAEKMNLYLPVKVAKLDILPLQCCFQCASTVLAWHELVVASVEADRRLRDIQFEVEKQLAGDELPGEAAEPGTSLTEEMEQNGQEHEYHDEQWSENQLYFCDLCPFISQHQTKFDNHICKRNNPNESNKQTNTKEPDKYCVKKPDEMTAKTKMKHKECDVTTNKKKLATTPEQIKMSKLKSKFNIISVDVLPSKKPKEAEVIKTITCEECNAEFSTENNLFLHKISHNNSEENQFDSELICANESEIITTIVCDECDSEFSTVNELVLHKESHRPAEKITNDIRLKQVPGQCDAECLTEKDLTKSHEETEQQKELDSKPALKVELAPEILQRNCQICDKIFKKLSQLRVHTRTHIIDKYCYVCCNSYNTQLKLDQHKSQHTEADLTLRKTDPAVVQCSQCIQTFCSKLKLYDHYRTHDNDAFACNKCPKKFNNNRSLNSHKGCHNILYKCKECNKLFAVKQILLQHLRTHHEKSFECNICNKKFRYQNNLKEHETMHNMLKKYKCDICKQRFARSNYLKTHLRIHFNDKPIACEYCECTFTQISVKNTHVKSKHRNCTVCNKNIGDSLQLRVHMWTCHPENEDDHSEGVKNIE